MSGQNLWTTPSLPPPPNNERKRKQNWYEKQVFSLLFQKEWVVSETSRLEYQKLNFFSLSKTEWTPQLFCQGFNFVKSDYFHRSFQCLVENVALFCVVIFCTTILRRHFLEEKYPNPAQRFSKNLQLIPQIHFLIVVISIQKSHKNIQVIACKYLDKNCC